MVLAKVMVAISLLTLVPLGNESALKITPVFRSIEKNTESSLDMTLSILARRNSFTATKAGVTAISPSSSVALELHDMATYTNDKQRLNKIIFRFIFDAIPENTVP